MGLPDPAQCWGWGLDELTGPLAQGWGGLPWARDPAQVSTWSVADMSAHGLLLNRCSPPRSPFAHETSRVHLLAPGPGDPAANTRPAPYPPGEKNVKMQVWPLPPRRGGEVSQGRPPGGGDN